MIRSGSGVCAALSGLLVVCTVGLACAPGEMDSADTGMVVPAASGTDTSAGSLTDTLVALPVPTPGGVRQDSLRRDSVRLDSVRIAAGRPRLPRPGTPVRLPAASRDTAARLDTTPRTVQGRVELEIDPKTFAPGDYLRVRLVAPGTNLETWTNRNGEFSFENAPANASELVFLTGDKLQRVVFRQFVRLGAGPIARLPVVHIPIDSI